MIIPDTNVSVNVWAPPPASVFKLNFDAAIFLDSNSLGFGAIIQNEKEEVMAAISIKAPPMGDSEEAEILVCRKALEFAI